ncbi:hypothetical protein V5O48_006363 [Marasmius crinis-equi]|uniref:Uncharacterized protein n=1 Tax=Marasmius crinis-equi TaxID=585013 RepID=A0ABR3FKC3_9AGAR
MASNEQLGEAVAPYLQLQPVIVEPLSTLSPIPIPGIYTCIFGSSLQTLTRRKSDSPSPNRRIYLPGTISLFLLATLYVTAYVWTLSRQTTIYFGAATSREYLGVFQYLVHDTMKSASM